MSAVRRRRIEILFDANPEAEQQLAFGLKQLGETLKKQLAEVTLNPEAASS